MSRLRGRKVAYVYGIWQSVCRDEDGWNGGREMRADGVILLDDVLFLPAHLARRFVKLAPWRA